MDKDDLPYLIRLSQERNMSPVGMVSRNMAFGRNIYKLGQLRPIFVPAIQIINKIRILSGVIGSAVQVKQGRFAEYRFTLSSHSLNFPPLSSLIEFSQDSFEIAKWIACISDILDDLPTNAEEVRDMIERNETIHGVPITDMVHQNNFRQ